MLVQLIEFREVMDSGEGLQYRKMSKVPHIVDGDELYRRSRLAVRLSKVDSSSTVMLTHRVVDVDYFGILYHRCWYKDSDKNRALFDEGRPVAIEIDNFANNTLDYFSYFENMTFVRVLGENRLFIVTNKHTFHHDIMQYRDCAHHGEKVWLITKGWLWRRQLAVYEQLSDRALRTAVS